MYIYIYIYIHILKIIPTKIRRLKTSGIFPMDMRIPPLKLEILLGSNPPKSRIVVRRLAVERGWIERGKIAFAVPQRGVRKGGTGKMVSFN